MKNYKLMLAGLIFGGLFGYLANTLLAGGPHHETLNFVIQNFMVPIGQIFLRLIFMVVVPLVISAIILGVFELTSHEGLGKIVLRTVVWTILLSTVSVLLGITLVNVFKPGVGLNISPESLGIDVSTVSKIQTNASQAKTIAQSIVELIPKNPLESALKAFEGEMLSLMVFSLIFGIAMGFASKTSKNIDSLKSFFEGAFETSMVVVTWAMKLAPIAVFALVFTSAAKLGPDIFKALFAYVAVVVAGLSIHMFIVYGFVLKTASKVSPKLFFKTTHEVILTAFSTSSSNATLPYSLACAEKKLGLKPRISRFVLTVGATANQNGTALFEGITVLFLAQFYNIDLSFAQQLQVVVMSIIAGVGTAGVPGGSLPLIVLLLQSVGIPAEGIGIILGVDRLLDMCRSAVNVAGDLVIATIVSDSST
jgi:dicarboxylate/amino acid:cation (Na+ or H+) symporter, DAACS family